MAFVKCKHAILHLAAEQELEVRLSDAASVADIVAWCHCKSIQVSVLHTRMWTSVTVIKPSS